MIGFPAHGAWQKARRPLPPEDVAPGAGYSVIIGQYGHCEPP